MHPRRRIPPRRTPLLAALTGALLVAACAPSAAGTAADGPAPAAQVARSPGGVVATGQPEATRAGAAMLARGGNAVDAAVAAAFALSVVEPSMSGLGGRTQILIRTPDGGIHGIDATTQAPPDYDYDSAPRAGHGYPVVGVPGTPAGLLAALERYGTLPRDVVLAPAVRLASEGFDLLPAEAGRHAEGREELLESEGARASFLRPDGTARSPGERWRQPDLARVLRALADEGADVFYRGWIADAIADDMAAHGGVVDRAALAAYRPERSRIVRGSYRGHQLAGLWMPSYGAITIEILQILETLPMAELRGGAWAAAVGQAVDVAYRDRSEQRSWADAERLTSPAWARRRAAEIRLPAAAGAGAGVDAGAPATRDAPVEHTTHLSAADGNGTVVALTQSNGPSLGSKVATPGLGFLYASTLGGYLGRLEGGERASSHISPLLVLREDGTPLMALGAAGGRRIPPAIVAVVSRVVDHGMSLADALRAPRAFLEDGEMDLEMETGMGWDDADAAAVRSLGLVVDPVTRSGAFGRVHAVLWDRAAGEWVGVADPDWEGSAAGPGGLR